MLEDSANSDVDDSESIHITAAERSKELTEPESTAAPTEEEEPKSDEPNTEQITDEEKREVTDEPAASESQNKIPESESNEGKNQTVSETPAVEFDDDGGQSSAHSDIVEVPTKIEDEEDIIIESAEDEEDLDPDLYEKTFLDNEYTVGIFDKMVDDDFGIQSLLSENELIEEPEAPTIDREMYYQLYKVYDREYQSAKMKNNFLQKKLADYYKKRKMDHVLRESTDVGSGDPTKKLYDKLLDAFEETTDNNTREQSRVINELEQLRWRRDNKLKQVEDMFLKLQEMEADVGNDIVKTNNKGDADKFFERYLKRQRSQMNYMIKIRREYTILKNLYQERLDDLNRLDHLGPGMHLSDYEQLKVDNRNHKDKLEEKELELVQLRTKCRNNIQILAHRREKETAVKNDIESQLEQLESVSMDLNYAREQLNSMKVEKVSLRKRIAKMKERTGLLTRPTLLKDMQTADKEFKTISETLDNYKEEYLYVSQQIRDARDRIMNYKIKVNDRDSVENGSSASLYISSKAVHL